MKIHKFKAAGALASIIQGKAGFIYFRKATLSGGAADDTIVIKGGGEEIVLQPGQGVPVDDPNVTAWEIYNDSGVGTIDGELVFNKLGFTDNRPSGKTEITAGTIEVVDANRTRVISGMSFAALLNNGPQAGERTFGQLANPVGSGKNLIVERVFLSSSTAGVNSMSVRTAKNTDWALATDVVVDRGSKLVTTGAPATVTDIRRGKTSGGGAIPTSLALYFFALSAGSTLPVEFKKPLVITPGYQLVLMNQTINADILCGVEWDEESITP